MIGGWTYGSPAVQNFNDGGALKMGRFCSTAEGVTFLLGGESRCDWVTTYPFNIVGDEARSFHGYPRCKGPVVFDSFSMSGFLRAAVTSQIDQAAGSWMGAESGMLLGCLPSALAILRAEIQS